MKKKITSLVLALILCAMILCVGGLSAFAAEEADATDTPDIQATAEPEAITPDVQATAEPEAITPDVQATAVPEAITPDVQATTEPEAITPDVQATAEPETDPAPDDDSGLSGFEVATVPVLVIICFGVGQIIKPCSLDNKWIPAIMVPVGAILGFIAFHVMPDFPASDPVTAVGIGVASGLAATGIHQIYKQQKRT